MKIMFADDELSMAALVQTIVTDAGYEFAHCSDGQMVLDCFATVNPDLLILDVMMPQLNGFDVCAQLRAQGVKIPILFLSAKGDIVDKSIGFKAGGDDYLVKPFAPLELTLRIEALLRRSSMGNVVSQLADAVISVGNFEICLAGRYAKLHGERIDLTVQELKLLSVLAAHPEQVFSREQLMELIWGSEYEGDLNTITVLVHRIREKIEDNPADPQYLQTVWRMGYRFAVPTDK